MTPMQPHYMRSLLLFLLLFQYGFIQDSLAAEITSKFDSHSNTQYEIVLESFTSEVIKLDCINGQILSGQFETFCDGRLYPGDDQRYDDWMLESIRFLILNETEYIKYSNDMDYTACYERNVRSLSWTYEIDATGKWYIVYYNPSIYLITVQSTIEQGHQDNLIGISLFTASFFLVILTILIGIKRKVNHS